MDWAHQHFVTHHINPAIRHPDSKYGDLFSHGVTVRESYERQIESAKILTTQQADELYLNNDPQTLIKDAIDNLVGSDPFPNLMFDGSEPKPHTNTPGFVCAIYRIPLDKAPSSLIWKLPPQIEGDGLSEHASLDSRVLPERNLEGEVIDQHCVELKYVFPQDVWDKREKGWLNDIVAKDIAWLKSAINDFHDAFEENAKRLTKLIHIAVDDKWRQVMDLAAEFADVPQPVVQVAAGHIDEDGRRYRVHRSYLFGQQKGICYGCLRRFCYDHMTVDHIRPQSKGGSHQLINLQLLCDPCNRLKGDGTQQELEAKLQAQGPKNAACSLC